MKTKMISAPGNQLEQVQSRFELWRKAHQPFSRIPEPLWASAVELAREQGLHRTSRALRLNYYSLKKRLFPIEGPPSSSPNQTRFVELLPSGAACTIEMENAHGGKMKIHLPSLGSQELAVLSHSLWRVS